MELLDETAIKALIVRERFARDTGQWKMLRDSYHPDASQTKLHTMWFDGDIDGFVAGSEKLHVRSGAIMHQVIPADIKFNESRAVADCWCLIQARLDMGPHEQDLKTSLRLLYRCEKVDGRWKLLSLEPIYIHDLVSPVPPAPMPQFDGLDRFRKSYCFTGWMLDRRGMAVANDLPGEDDQKTVDDIHKRHREWLESGGALEPSRALSGCSRRTLP